MELIDTHCHLTDEAFKTDAEACIERAKAAGVGRIVLACCEAAEVNPILTLSHAHPGILFPTLGIHPENLADDIEAQLAEMRTLLETHHGELVAIGEIGIDLHWDTTRLADQLRVLAEQLDWAIEYDLPVLLHIRDAMPQFLDFMRAYINNKVEASQPSARTEGATRLRGILHCYSGTADEAREAQQLCTLLIGIGGTLTYKRSAVPDVARQLGADAIVLETDAPYLAPVPQRGHRNEPAFTLHTAEFLAGVLGLSPQSIAEKTTANAKWLLGL